MDESKKVKCLKLNFSLINLEVLRVVSDKPGPGVWGLCVDDVCEVSAKQEVYKFLLRILFEI